MGGPITKAAGYGTCGCTDTAAALVGRAPVRHQADQIRAVTAKLPDRLCDMLYNLQWVSRAKSTGSAETEKAADGSPCGKAFVSSQALKSIVLNGDHQHQQVASNCLNLGTCASICTTSVSTHARVRVHAYASIIAK
eukprot:6197663-Pleurochrysis_carterae.AAC.3